jgi:signal peptidase I
VGRQDLGDMRGGERRASIAASSLAFLLFIIVVLCLPNVGPIFRIFSIPSAANEPTLRAGSYVVVSRASYGYSRYSFDSFELPIAGRWPSLMPKRGDMIVFRLPRDTLAHLVRRVVGLPGDRIQMVNGSLSINGEVVPREPAPKLPDPSGGKGEADVYVEHLPEGASYRVLETNGDNGPYDNTPEFVVPPGHLFVLGDNRDNSIDSRFPPQQGGFGFVPIEVVVGRVIFAF